MSDITQRKHIKSDEIDEGKIKKIINLKQINYRLKKL